MQKTIINKSRFIIDIDTVNSRTGFYNVDNEKICIFLGHIQIYYYKKRKWHKWVDQFS